MEHTAFVYIIHIAATPEEVWDALIRLEFTERYWGVSFETDWRVGSQMTWVENRMKTTHADQVVLEFDPPRRLAYTWHTFTPAWAEAVGVSEELLADIAAEPRSKVTFEIEPEGGAVKLTVTHDGFEPGSTVRDMIGQGWPQLLSSLKSLLETGEPLPSE